MPSPPLGQFQPLIPAEIEAVILRALAKDPTQRYKYMQAFALAYRKALEASASSQTDAHEQQYTTQALEHDEEDAGTVMLDQRTAGPENVPDEAKQEQIQTGKVLTLSQVATAINVDQTAPETAERRSKADLAGEKLRPRQKHPLRTALLVLLVVLLLAGGTLGGLYVANPCVMGVCPVLSLSANNIHLTNDEQQAVTIRNNGNADLNWTAHPAPNYTLPTLSAPPDLPHPVHPPPHT